MHALNQFFSIAGIEVHADELISTDTKRGVARTCVRRLADMCLESAGKLADISVACGMAMTVVDLFKVVQIPCHKQKWFSSLASDGLQTVELAVETMAIEESGQAVAVGEDFELFIGLIQTAKRGRDIPPIRTIRIGKIHFTENSSCTSKMKA